MKGLRRRGRERDGSVELGEGKEIEGLRRRERVGRVEEKGKGKKKGIEEKGK